MLTMPWHIDNSKVDTPAPVCPQCKSALYRINRRPLDRLLSLVMPVQRYRCWGGERNMNCHWEGNLRTDLQGRPEETASAGVRDRHSGSISHWFFGATPDRASSQAKKASRSSSVNKTAEVFNHTGFENMARITLDAIADAVLATDAEGRVVYLNNEAKTLTGWPGDQALGRPVDEVLIIVDDITRRRVVVPSQKAIRDNKVVELALGCVLVRRDGSDLAIEDLAAPIYDHDGKIAGAVIVFHDARHSQAELDKMSYLAQHDALTGLPNRTLLKERLSQAVGMAVRHRKQVALLFMDLDDFKQVNDSLGHEVGDQLLRDVAADIATCVRSTDTLSRLGGDEFVILLSEIDKPQDAALVATQIVNRLSAPRKINDSELQVTLSIGISVYPEDGADAETLMRHADSAMYSAKEAGRNNYQFFQREVVAAPAALNSRG